MWNLAFYEFIVLDFIYETKWHSWIFYFQKWWRQKKFVLSLSAIISSVSECVFVLHMQIPSKLHELFIEMRLQVYTISIDFQMHRHRLMLLLPWHGIWWWNRLHLFNLPTSLWSDWITHFGLHVDFSFIYLYSRNINKMLFKYTKEDMQADKIRITYSKIVVHIRQHFYKN